MNKTFSFPIGRDQSPQQSFLYRFSKNPVPGPGTVLTSLFSMKIKWKHKWRSATRTEQKQLML